MKVKDLIRFLEKSDPQDDVVILTDNDEATPYFIEVERLWVQVRVCTKAPETPEWAYGNYTVGHEERVLKWLPAGGPNPENGEMFGGPYAWDVKWLRTNNMTRTVINAESEEGPE